MRNIVINLQLDAPYEIAGKRKRWDTIKHLLIAKALREAFCNNASGCCGSSTITINTATIDAVCGFDFTPKLKEFLYVVSVKLTIIVFFFINNSIV